MGSFLGWKCQKKSVNKHLLKTWLLWETAGERTDQKVALKEHIIYQGIQLCVGVLTTEKLEYKPAKTQRQDVGISGTGAEEKHKAERLGMLPAS